MTTIIPSNDKRNILITSALPYVNNVPHLGNIIGSVLSADVYARFCRKRGYNVLYICGTDDYGTTSEFKALEENITPHELCNKYHKLHKKIYNWFNINFDHFGKTSCKDPINDNWEHTKITHNIFNDLLKNGYIKEKTIEQIFCEGCQKFLADRFIKGICPYCLYDGACDQCDQCGRLIKHGHIDNDKTLATSLINPRCKFNEKHKIIKKKSNHLFLDLMKLENKLNLINKDHWCKNTKTITSEWFKRGLHERCITRDLKWGTPVPYNFSDGKKKVFYVWFDAPIGYISITDNYLKDKKESWEQWWKGNNIELAQFFSKDNVPFHTILFPATLIGTNNKFIIPKRISCVHYLTHNGKKYSKSNKIGIFGDDAMNSGIPSDIWRYYLLSIRPETSDSSFNWTDFVNNVNGNLVNNCGNMIYRILLFTHTQFETLPKPHIITEYDEEFIDKINEQLQNYYNSMEKCELRTGLNIILQMSKLANKYITESSPWNMIYKDKLKCGSVMNVLINFIKLLASLMSPFLPETSDKIKKCLRCDLNFQNKFTLELKQGIKIKKPEKLFTKLEKIKNFKQ